MIFAMLFEIAFNKKLTAQIEKHSRRVSHQRGDQVYSLTMLWTDALHG